MAKAKWEEEHLNYNGVSVVRMLLRGIEGLPSPCENCRDETCETKPWFKIPPELGCPIQKPISTFIVSPVYMNRERGTKASQETTPKNSKTCMTCKWVQFSGPHIGCFYGGWYRKWLSRKFAQTYCCENYEVRGQ